MQPLELYVTIFYELYTKLEEVDFDQMSSISSLEHGTCIIVKDLVKEYK